MLSPIARIVRPAGTGSAARRAANSPSVSRVSAAWPARASYSAMTWTYSSWLSPKIVGSASAMPGR